MPDPLSIACAAGTVVQLLGQFLTSRKSRRDATIGDFRDWLGRQGHEQVVTQIRENTELSQALFKLLSGNQEELLAKLGDLKTMSAETLDRIGQMENKLREMDLAAPWKQKYSLGYAIFYADESTSDIRRVEHLRDAVVLWDHTHLLFHDAEVTIDTSLTTHSGRGSVDHWSKTYSRNQPVTDVLGSFFGTTVVFELVEDTGRGVVAVIGFKPNTNPADSNTAVVISSPNMKISNIRIGI
jgi:hypothetical protein